MRNFFSVSHFPTPSVFKRSNSSGLDSVSRSCSSHNHLDLGTTSTTTPLSRPSFKTVNSKGTLAAPGVSELRNPCAGAVKKRSAVTVKTSPKLMDKFSPSLLKKSIPQGQSCKKSAPKVTYKWRAVKSPTCQGSSNKGGNMRELYALAENETQTESGYESCLQQTLPSATTGRTMNKKSPMLVRKLNVALPDWYWTGAPGFPEQVTLPSVLRKGGAKLSKTFNSLRKKAVKVTRGVVKGGHGGPAPCSFFNYEKMRF